VHSPDSARLGSTFGFLPFVRRFMTPPPSGSTVAARFCFRLPGQCARAGPS